MDIQPEIPSSSPTSPVTVVAAPPPLLANKWPSTAALIVVVVLFLMPFIEIKCNNMTFKTISGTELAFGVDMGKSKAESLFDGLGGENNNTVSRKSEKKDPYWLAAAALGLAVIALLFSFSKSKGGAYAAVGASALAALAMIGIMIDIQTSIAKEASVEAGTDAKISVGFTPWFYLCLLLLILSAWLSYRRAKLSGIVISTYNK